MLKHWAFAPCGSVDVIGGGFEEDLMVQNESADPDIPFFISGIQEVAILDQRPLLAVSRQKKPAISRRPFLAIWRAPAEFEPATLGFGGHLGSSSKFYR